TSTVRSPTRSDRVLAMRPGSTPWASAARATVAVLVSSSMMRRSGAFSAKNRRTDSRLMGWAPWRKPTNLCKRAEDVVELTGHPVGGVCPFGLATPLAVYCDVSLQAFDEVLPAAGAVHSAVRIAPQRMAELVDAQWVDVCQEVLQEA
ncbi:YbaK/EbsC family protein, partial [Pseudomonas aeruginosa]